MRDQIEPNIGKLIKFQNSSFLRFSSFPMFNLISHGLNLISRKIFFISHGKIPKILSKNSSVNQYSNSYESLINGTLPMLQRVMLSAPVPFVVVCPLIPFAPMGHGSQGPFPGASL